MGKKLLVAILQTLGVWVLYFVFVICIGLIFKMIGDGLYSYALIGIILGFYFILCVFDRVTRQ